MSDGKSATAYRLKGASAGKRPFLSYFNAACLPGLFGTSASGALPSCPMPRRRRSRLPLVFRNPSSGATSIQSMLAIAEHTLRMPVTNIGTDQLHRDQTIAWRTSVPRSCSRSSAFRSEGGKRMHSIIARRMVPRLFPKYLKEAEQIISRRRTILRPGSGKHILTGPPQNLRLQRFENNQKYVKIRYKLLSC